jgi:hypothetical protein
MMSKLTKNQKKRISRKNKHKSKKNVTTVDKLNFSATIIQKYYRGSILRKKRLPLFLYVIQQYLTKFICEISNDMDDGRINSCKDENTIIANIQKSFPYRIRVPDKRFWFDILILDRLYGWLPVNIKSTTMQTADNTGNLAMCVYGFTDYQMDPYSCKNTYNNGKMADVLIKKIQTQSFNTLPKRDYYFLVINKKNPTDIIINSLKGLHKLTPNINNLPFQVKWIDNRDFEYKPIKQSVEYFIKTLQKPKPSWQERFLQNIRDISIG